MVAHTACRGPPRPDREARTTLPWFHRLVSDPDAAPEPAACSCGVPSPSTLAAGPALAGTEHDGWHRSRVEVHRAPPTLDVHPPPEEKQASMGLEAGTGLTCIGQPFVMIAGHAHVGFCGKRIFLVESHSCAGDEQRSLVLSRGSQANGPLDLPHRQRAVVWAPETAPGWLRVEAPFSRPAHPEVRALPSDAQKRAPKRILCPARRSSNRPVTSHEAI